MEWLRSFRSSESSEQADQDAKLPQQNFVFPAKRNTEYEISFTRIWLLCYPISISGLGGEI